MEKTKTKKIYYAILFSIIAVLIASVSFFAYFTDNVNTDASVTVGNVGIELHEDFPETDEYGATTTTKTFWGVSTGSMDEYVRAQIITNVQVKDDTTGKWATTALISSDDIGYDISGTTLNNWVKGDNDYYYHKKVVKPSSSTEKFYLTNIKSKVPLPDELKGKHVRINMTVAIECAQASNDNWKLVWGINSLPSGVESHK